jgi:hypothetical protein
MPVRLLPFDTIERILDRAGSAGSATDRVPGTDSPVSSEGKRLPLDARIVTALEQATRDKALIDGHSRHVSLRPDDVITLSRGAGRVGSVNDADAVDAAFR